MKFNGASGKKPSAEARRYLYTKIANLLHGNLDDFTFELYDDEDLDEFDRRRLMVAARHIIKELRRKAAS